MKTIFAFAALMLISAIQACANQAEGMSFGFGRPSTVVTIGLGATPRKTPYDRIFKTNFVPYLRYKENDVTIGFAQGVSYQFLSNYNLSASVAIKPRFFPYGYWDTTALRGMTRNSSFDFSLNAALDVIQGISVLIEAATEHTGKYEGQEFDLVLRQFILGLGTPFYMKAGLKRQKEKLASYLYRVQAYEQLSIRPVYGPRPVFTRHLSANAIYGVTERRGLFENTGFTFHPRKVLDSPIINALTSFNLVGSLAFTF